MGTAGRSRPRRKTCSSLWKVGEERAKQSPSRYEHDGRTGAGPAGGGRGHDPGPAAFAGGGAVRGDGNVTSRSAVPHGAAPHRAPAGRGGPGAGDVPPRVAVPPHVSTRDEPEGLVVPHSAQRAHRPLSGVYADGPNRGRDGRTGSG